jgi:aerobic carbon-monoxide dehydrogenase large subunit
VPLTGQAIPRVEDFNLLTGRAKYTADLSPFDALNIAFVRSSMAHGTLVGVELDEASQAPGVVAILGPTDLPSLGFITEPRFLELLPPPVHRTAFCDHHVRFAGEIIMAVVADTQAHAIDAAELVVVEIDELPPVVGIERALTNGAALLFPELGSNVVFESHFSAGDPPTVPVVAATLEVESHKMAPLPLESLSILAIPDAIGERMTAYVSTQRPHALRDFAAQWLTMAPEEIDVICPAVGGGFGGKVPAVAEYAITLAAARHLRRPVRWTQTRSENLAQMQGRGHQFKIALEATCAGEIRALHIDAITDLGAYPGYGLGPIHRAKSLATGAYRIPHVTYHIRGVATTVCPTGVFRGSGRPEAAHLIERAVDVLATKLDMDSVELRRRNLLRRDDFPHTTVMGTTYDTGDYHGTLDYALEKAGYDELRRQQAELRFQGAAKLLGIGLSTYVETSAAGNGLNGEHASIDLLTDGTVEGRVGTSAHGQGHDTVFSQIVADVFAIPMTAVRIVTGDTRTVPSGWGTGGSRSGQIGGSALKLAAEQVLVKARDLASRIIEVSADDIVVEGGGLQVAGVPASRMSWSELASMAHTLSANGETELRAEVVFEQADTGTAPFGCHVAVVEVDVDTGDVRLKRIVAVDDCGKILNPLIVQGQVHGGICHGIAESLYEQITFDEYGNLTSGTLADYLAPSAADVPSFEVFHQITPSISNPLGAKGVGEAGATGSLAAIHNAVADALSHLDVGPITTPVTPMKVWAAIDAARRKSAAATSAEFG